MIVKKSNCAKAVYKPTICLLTAAILVVFLGGCGPSYRYLRQEGQKAMIAGDQQPAKVFFLQAEEKSPRHTENLYDLGVCSLMIAKRKLDQQQKAAAMREVDHAIEYFSQAIDVHPGHQASIEGLNNAYEVKGQFDRALQSAEWAAKYLGPSAKQYIFLAKELEQRGDVDGALLRYRQAVSVEPENAQAHRAFSKFLIRNDNEEAAVYHLKAAYQLNPRDDWVVGELVARGALPPLVVAKQSIK